MNMPRVLVPLADGFEEIEAITIIDVLRRAGCDVVVAGFHEGAIMGSRKTGHLADTVLESVLEHPFEAIVLPGGQPASNTLASHEGLRQRLQRQSREGGWVAAICAAPLALDKAGLLEGKRFTCHPSAACNIRSGTPLEERVVVDGKLVTSQAAGTAMAFALELVRLLCGEAKVREVNLGLLSREEL